MINRGPLRTIKNFYFTRKLDELLADLGDITIVRYKGLLDKIYNRYPLVSHLEIVIIILTTFEVIRELLIRGCIINIERFFIEFKLHFFQHNRNGEKVNNAIKAKIKTPPPLKERPSWEKRKLKTQI